MAVVRLSGHDEKNGVLELLRLFFGSATVTADGDLQGGASEPVILSCFSALPEGGCRVETGVHDSLGNGQPNLPAEPGRPAVIADASHFSAAPKASRQIALGCVERMLTRTLDCGRAGARPERLARREIKRQLYELLSQLTGQRFPYGSLTGIRPTRLAAEQLSAGRTSEEVSRHLTLEFGVAPEKSCLLAATAGYERSLLAALPKDQPLLYVHIPFCPTRCSYCSFTCETAGSRRVNLDTYVDAMIMELQRLAPHFRQPAAAIYIGGGTPTVLSAAQLSRLLNGILSVLPRTTDTEFTVEAGRADTIDDEKLAIIHTAGARRICVNPQTLLDRTLDRIGRKHTRADWLDAFHSARAAGFPIINADLIAGLPGEQPADFLTSLTELMREAPENITIHTLAFKRKSELTRAARQENNDDDDTMSADADTWSKAMDEAHHTLARAGYEPYYLYRQKDMIGGLENTGYALPGTACRYNVGMMSDERMVVGIGAGAMSKYIDTSGSLRRLPAPRDLATWLRGLDAATEIKIRTLFGD